MPYSTAVATAFDVMRKPPSPHTATARRGELGPEHTADGEAHRGEAPRLQERLRLVDRPLLHHPVVVDTDVDEDDAVSRHRTTERADDVLGLERNGIRPVAPLVELRPVTLPRGHLAQPFLVAAPSVPGLGQGEQRGHEALHVGDHTEVDRIIAADLLGVDVDVDEPRGWDRERV